MSRRDVIKEEHTAWREICRQLVMTGAVTEADLAAPAGRNRTTGERLLTTIRYWGERVKSLEQTP